MVLRNSMNNMVLRNQRLTELLNTLEEALVYFDTIQIYQHISLSFMSNVQLKAALRDSLRYRFGLCTDLFLNYLKKYLEEEGMLKIEINFPKVVIKTACKAGLLEEDDAELAIKMIGGRNLTSHIYKDEFAEKLSFSIESYYKLMQKYAEKILPR